MLEIVKDYWAIIAGFFGVAVWVGRLQKDVSYLKEGAFVTNGHCIERQAGCARTNAFQFADGEKQFARLEKLIEKIEGAQQKHHDDVMKAILGLKKS